MPEPTLGVLADDLAEIRHDRLPLLRGGNAGPRDLLWQARFDFVSHWSLHALNVLRASHPTM